MPGSPTESLKAAEKKASGGQRNMVPVIMGRNVGVPPSIPATRA
jgi:hypothetical protein